MSISSEGASPKVRPILFSGPMIGALLEGRKSQTRRIIKPHPHHLGGGRWQYMGSEWDIDRIPIGPGLDSPLDYCKWQRGDMLWVRECFSYLCNGSISPRGIWCWADGNPENGDWSIPKPSIHMPRWGSRLTLEISDVRVERLQDISESDAIAEGIEMTKFWREEHPPSICYAVLWDSLHGTGSWNANPWVWVLSFRVHQQNIDNFLKRIAAAQEVRG